MRANPILYDCGTRNGYRLAPDIIRPAEWALASAVPDGGGAFVNMRPTPWTGGEKRGVTGASPAGGEVCGVSGVSRVGWGLAHVFRGIRD